MKKPARTFKRRIHGLRKDCHRIAVLQVAAIVLMAASPPAPGVEAKHAHVDFEGARSVVSLDVHSTGDVVDLLTGERASAKSAATLWHRRSADGGKSWSQAVRVDQGMPSAHRPHRSNDPQISANGPLLIAVWASAGRGYGGSGPMVTALSKDGGKTWRRGPNPADDNRHDGHGYADLVESGGRFHLTWLDSRGGAQGVRYASSDDAGGHWSANASVKSGSCECCWNTLLPAQDRALYLLFRGKAPRDMGLSLSPDAGATWKQLGAVGAFNWQIDACPHTGGALALTGQATAQRLHALVWTGKPEVRGVHYLNSRDAGSSWSSTVRLGGEYAQRADLAARASELIAVWDEAIGQSAAIFLARSRNSGDEWTKPVRLSSEGLNASYPRVVAAKSNWLVLWTEASGNDSKLRMILIR